MYKYFSNIRIDDDLEVPLLFNVFIEPTMCEIIDAHEIVNGEKIRFDIDEIDEELLSAIEEKAYKAWEAKY
jgi:hypothetical protein